MNLVANIKRLCKQSGTTISKLEKSLGFGRGSIYVWDKSHPSISKVMAVADFFDVPIQQLLGRDVPVKAEKSKEETAKPLTMTTTDLIEALRADIASDLKAQILAELEPEIKRRLYSNIFDIKEAALYLKLSESTLRRMVRDGEVPYFKQRGNIYFRQIDLDKHIENRIIRKDDRQ
ncbi:helix-turn-helix domain-containing protein [Paenibacillus sp. FSL M8-0334]|uniref:helix-turn-helix domain-containing protein n=1 Tax=Paenibacillus sp. FSL M8-0334 TaxID=2921623 RepID=UPI0030F923CF